MRGTVNARHRPVTSNFDLPCRFSLIELNPYRLTVTDCRVPALSDDGPRTNSVHLGPVRVSSKLEIHDTQSSADRHKRSRSPRHRRLNWRGPRPLLGNKLASDERRAHQRGPATVLPRRTIIHLRSSQGRRPLTSAAAGRLMCHPLRPKPGPRQLPASAAANKGRCHVPSNARASPMGSNLPTTSIMPI